MEVIHEWNTNHSMQYELKEPDLGELQEPPKHLQYHSGFNEVDYDDFEEPPEYEFHPSKKLKELKEELEEYENVPQFKYRDQDDDPMTATPKAKGDSDLMDEGIKTDRQYDTYLKKFWAARENEWYDNPDLSETRTFGDNFTDDKLDALIQKKKDQIARLQTKEELLPRKETDYSQNWVERRDAYNTTRAELISENKQEDEENRLEFQRDNQEDLDRFHEEQGEAYEAAQNAHKALPKSQQVFESRDKRASNQTFSSTTTDRKRDFNGVIEISYCIK